MSLFKKPKRKFSQRANISDLDLDNDDKSDKTFEETSGNSGDSVTDRKKPEKISSLLSFSHEDEDVETFKVKKSNYSQRLARELKKERRRKQNQDKKQEECSKKLPSLSVDEKEKAPDPLNDGLEIKIKNTITVQNSDPPESKSSSSSRNGDEVQKKSSTWDKKISAVTEFTGDAIPDAATIYALKKKRQRAREMSDFIPLPTDNDACTESKLVDEYDSDRSDDNEEGRVNFTVNTANIEREKAREALLEAQTDKDDSLGKEEAAELEKWEQEQMKKGISTAPLSVAQQESQSSKEVPYSSSYGTQAFTMFSPGGGSKTLEEASTLESKNQFHYQVPKDKENLTTMSVIKRVTDRFNALQETRASHEREQVTRTREMECSAASIEELEESFPKLSAKFQFFQEFRSYIIDLIECLDSKMPVILALEGRMLSLLCQRSEKLVNRRHRDVKDEAEEFTGKGMMSGGLTGDLSNKNASKHWRAAEREGRRVRRRKARESKSASIQHYEGMSTDDEELDTDLLKFKQDKDSILNDLEHVFDDVREDYSNVLALKLHFEKWKFNYPDSYKEAYIPLCIVKVLAPFVRLQLVPWNPVESPDGLESMQWFEILIFYGKYDDDDDQGVSSREERDSDLCIIPRIMDKIVVQKLTVLAEKVWDPMSSQQTLNLVRITKKLIMEYPSVNGKSRNVQNYLHKVVCRIQRALEEDVYIPLYPKEVMENRSGGPAVFFNRQFWSAVKLLKNILSWQGIIAEEPLKELALGCLLNRYIIIGLKSSIPLKDVIDKCKCILSVLPASWQRNSSTPMPQLELFYNLLKYVQQTESTDLQEGKMSQAHWKA